METNEILNLIHILIIGPILINVGYRKKTTSKIVFNVLLLIGVAVIIYHTYLFFKQLNKKAVKEQFDSLNKESLEITENFSENQEIEESFENNQEKIEAVNDLSSEAFEGYSNYTELDTIP